MKPTPGPWVIDWNVSRLDVFSSDAATLVATLRRSTLSDGIDKTAISNARLIAAAPDLLEALQRINEACAQIPEGLEGYLEHLSDAISDARKALAKATGEQQ
jgi:hypothetical protein